MKLWTTQKFLFDSPLFRTMIIVAITLCSLSTLPLYLYFHSIYNRSALTQQNETRSSIQRILLDSLLDASRFGDFVNARGLILKRGKPLGLIDLGLCQNGNDLIPRFAESRCQKEDNGNMISVSTSMGQLDIYFRWGQMLLDSEKIFFRSLISSLSLSLILVSIIVVVTFLLLRRKVQSISREIAHSHHPQDLLSFNKNIPELSPIIQAMHKLFEKVEASHIEASRLRTDAVIGRLASDIAHDLRSPLSALQILSHHLETMGEKEAALMAKTIRRIDDIANGLLDKRKVEIVD